MPAFLAILLLLPGCVREGETEFVADADDDGVPQPEDCDDHDPAVGSATQWWGDRDGDGYGYGTPTTACTPPDRYVDNADDCDDTDPAVNPAATEICDGIDNDCDGGVDDGGEIPTWYEDRDHDGYGDDATAVRACAAPAGTIGTGGDCDDQDPAQHPGAAEDCTSTEDLNCDGSIGYADADLDGYPACEDCNDGDSTVFPGAAETCDGVDDNCNGVIDDEPVDGASWYRDLDADGYGDPYTRAFQCEAPEGYVADDDDCDDAAAEVHPGAVEVCNGTDDNCDGVVDEDAIDATTWYRDGDADGYGDSLDAEVACEAPLGYSALAGDCDDSDPAYNPGADESDCTDPEDYNCDGSTGYVDVDGDGYPACQDCDDADAARNPGATEACNGFDDDCDGDADEAGAAGEATWYADADGDGYGDAAVATIACDAPAGYVSDATDCDDTEGARNPGEIEICDDLDNDCDGEVDTDAAWTATWYEDADGDGYGDDATALSACDAPPGTVDEGGDCDDEDADIHPLATEYCDGVDTDCDGVLDGDDAVDARTWYLDRDADGYGTDADTEFDCDTIAGYAEADGDCDDEDDAVHPGAEEICNGADDDCNGVIDDDPVGSGTYYADDDGDGYGDPAAAMASCGPEEGYVEDATDCDDDDATVSPGGVESCNGQDDDCDGSVDEGVTTTYYADDDGDGYGDPLETTEACAVPTGYATNDDDCDDSRRAVNPGASESCNGVDDDCNGAVDDGVGSTYYADADGDGYGDPRVSTVSCSTPSGYAANDDDCDDTDATNRPGGVEHCDDIDEDCDGTVDEDAVDDDPYYLDGDGDGYGDGAATYSCDPIAGYADEDGDCDDGDEEISPDALEYCDGIDNDCDGDADEESVCNCTLATDADGDDYLFCTSTASWSAGSTYCREWGAELVGINDATENTWVVNTAYGLSRSQWWTGGTDAAVEGTWRWRDGTTWSYTNWAAGEPNDSGTGEDCLQLGRWLDYTWNDEPCSAAYRWICEHGSP
jgi:hypothetical protein